ncbi:hypothetical protein GCM10007423_39990 [Dyadobacter endophyticus]|uniref:Uncharacterized protein n=1 Tax=Dyadobacter endophyticus TaxID=1749036 RepID=A0ABQ1YXZ8_9BACT|nr:hypothetical protein [Dyadobacter endophyticus]GGH42966.1 hypothetical protein GCM10007423_39990 [Dyadobacter endophyticus]
MSQARRERRALASQQAKPLKKFIDLSIQQKSLEEQFAEVFRESGLDPYGAHSEQFQMALKTHGVE